MNVISELKVCIIPLMSSESADVISDDHEYVSCNPGRDSVAQFEHVLLLVELAAPLAPCTPVDLKGLGVSWDEHSGFLDMSKSEHSTIGRHHSCSSQRSRARHE